MTSDEALQAHFKNERERFLNMMNSIVILDIGVIDSVDDNGRAHVTSSSFTNNRPIVYEDAEVIYPGNANGCFVSQSTGMACLIFLPKSCMPDVTNLELFVGSTSYNRDGVKVMPIGNGTNNTVRAFFGNGGEYSILGQSYKIVCKGDDVTFQKNDGSTSLTIDGTGQMYVKRQTNSGTLTINVEDTGVTKQWLSQNKDVLWTDTYKPDGSRTFVQSDPNDEEADPLFSMSIAADGTVAFNMVKGLTFVTEDALVLKGKTVEIEATDGTMTMTSSDTFSVNGSNLEVDPSE